MSANRSSGLGRTGAVAFAVLAACWGARAPQAAEPLGPARDGAPAPGAAVWRQDLLDRVTLRSTGAATDLATVKAQDSRKRLEKPEVARWVIRAIDRSEYKRKQAAPGLKITSKAFGMGRRIPIAARFEF